MAKRSEMSAVEWQAHRNAVKRASAARCAVRKSKNNRGYYLAHKRDHHRRAREWLARNPDARRQIKRRAKLRRKRGLRGPHHTERQFLEACERHGWRCWWCGCGLDARTVTRDHVVPIAKDGSDLITNIVPACRDCNSRKRDRIIEARQGTLI